MKIHILCVSDTDKGEDSIYLNETTLSNDICIQITRRKDQFSVLLQRQGYRLASNQDCIGCHRDPVIEHIQINQVQST